MNKPAAIYARVSSDRQKENHTIASQTAALIEYAQKNGYSVPPEWVFQDEGYSGAVLVRPGLEKLRDLAAEGQIAAVLVYSPDRLSRKYAYQVLLSEELSRCGVELIFLKGASGSDAGGSIASTVSGHDRRIRARPDRRALPSRQEAHGATGRSERAFRRAVRLPIREKE
jgi:DNA invertase Pin-like site-specific DNA recombinase